MDPKACLEALFRADSAGDMESYNGYKESLIEWLNRGGFGPKVRHMPTDREGTLVKLKWGGRATVRWNNNRQTEVRLWDLDVSEVV